MLGLRDVAGALEHDVLEQVGEAGLAGLLVLGADVVPEVDRHDRRQVVLGDDDAQAVGEAGITERDGRDGRGHAAAPGSGRRDGRRGSSGDDRSASTPSGG